MLYSLPIELEICGSSYEIRSDYRAVLDICTALSDPELDDYDRAAVILDIFYPAFDTMPQEHYQEAIEKCFWFVNCGDETNTGNRKAPKLVDWKQDFQYIVAPINRVSGQEVRALPYMHWWTFIGFYYEIGGDCTFAQIVQIRDKLAKGKKLDKSEREWYRQNRHMVDFKTTYTKAEEEFFKTWGGTNEQKESPSD